MRSTLVAAAVLAASLAVSPAQRDARVTIYIAVEDQAGRPERSVAADALSLSVDGIPRPIESVVRADQPLSAILLVDTSASMKSIAPLLQRSAKDLIANLGESDRWRIGVFGDRILFAREFASGRRSFDWPPPDPIEVRTRPVRGGSPLWDAVRQSVELLAEQGGRRTLVVMTDGRASGNQYGLEEVAEFTADGAVSVSAIVPVPAVGIRQDRQTMAVVSPAANLDRLARYTGGVLLGGYDPKDAPLRQMLPLAHRLRAGHAVTFVMPTPDSRRHRLEIGIATRGLQVRAPLAFRVASR